MRVLMTGATGFIGTQLKAALVQRGHEVTPIDPRAHGFPGTLGDFDAILHLAGEPIAGGRWNLQRKRKILESRTRSTRALVDAIESQNPPKLKSFVCASAVGYYGDRGDETLTEESMRGVGFLADVCVEWEKEAKRAKDLGVRVVSIRTGMVLGMGGGALPKLLPAFKKGLGGRLGTGEQFISWIHVEDLVNLYVYALETPTVIGSINGCTPHPVKNKEFTRILAGVLRRPAFFKIPAPVLKLVLGEMNSVLLSSQKALPVRTLQMGFAFRYEGLQPALIEITQAPSRP